jgi:uncharacterized coiled-coil protein SlyX
MSVKEQQKQIIRLQQRLTELVDELRSTQSDINSFKESVARDIKRTIELVNQKR